MSGTGAELQKATSTNHARLQLQRSTSEATNIPNHQRSFHHTHLHHRDKAEKVEKSSTASLLPSASFDVMRSEAVTPNGSQCGSRRTSVVPSTDDMPRLIGPLEERRAVKEGEIKAEKDKNSIRAAELQKSLEGLNKLSHDTNSRLDVTYYNVLEKLSILHSTIAALKELASLTRQLNDDFIEESTDAVQDIETQLDSFDDFHPQEQKIENLQQRIEKGREKAHILGDRVNVVKQKIARWEKVESEWQLRTRKRVTVIWAIIAAALLIVVGLVVFQYTPARTYGPNTLRGFNVSNITTNLPELEAVFGNDTRSLKRSATNTLDKLKQVPLEELDEDPRLRGFDEL